MASAKQLKNIIANNAFDLDPFIDLPQPMKTICKIIEYDILDRAWFQILRNHPELQVDSDGNVIPLDRNHKLRTSFPAEISKTVERSYSTIRPCNDITCAIDVDGIFSILDTKTLETILLKNLSTIKVKQEKTIPESVIVTPAANFRIPASFTIHSTEDQHSMQEIDQKHFSFHSRLLTHSLLLHTEEVLPEGKSKKPKPGQLPEEPIFKKSAKHRVLVIDVIQCKHHENTTYSIELVHEILLDSEQNVEDENGLEKVIFTELNFELSDEGKLLNFTSNGKSDVFQLLKLSDPAESELKAKENTQIELEVTPGEVEVEQTTTVEEKEIPELELKKTEMIGKLSSTCYDSILHGSTVLATYLIPKILDTSMMDINLKQTESKKELPSEETKTIETVEEKIITYPEYDQMEIVVLLKNSPFFLLLRCRAKSETEIKTLQASQAPPVETKPSKGKNVEPPPPPPSICPLDFMCLTEIPLTASITASALCPKKQLLAVGLKDGTVLLWSILKRTLIKPLGKHSSAVVALNLHRDMESGELFIVSGAIDGTLCFYTREGVARFQEGPQQLNSTMAMHFSAMTLLSDVPGAAGSSVEPEEMIGLTDFREDARGAAIIQIQIQSQTAPTRQSSLAFVQYSSGVTGIYNFRTCELLGRIGQKDRINYENIYSSLISWSNFPKPKEPEVVEPTEEELALIAQQEAEAAAAAEKLAKKGKKGATGKKGKEVKEEPPVEVIEEKPPEEVPPKKEPEGLKEEEKEEDFRTDQWSLENVLGTIGEQGSLVRLKYCAVMSVTDDSWFVMVQKMKNTETEGIVGENCLLKGSLDFILPLNIGLNKEVTSMYQMDKNKLKSNYNSVASLQPFRKTNSISSLNENTKLKKSFTLGKGVNVNPSQLRLTEERLLALENSFNREGFNSNTSLLGSKNGDNSVGTQKPALRVTPSQVVRTEALRSKFERNSRKEKLMSNVKDLISIF